MIEYESAVTYLIATYFLQFVEDFSYVFRSRGGWYTGQSLDYANVNKSLFCIRLHILLGE